MPALATCTRGHRRKLRPGRPANDQERRPAAFLRAPRRVPLLLVALRTSPPVSVAGHGRLGSVEAADLALSKLLAPGPAPLGTVRWLAQAIATSIAIHARRASRTVRRSE